MAKRYSVVVWDEDGRPNLANGLIRSNMQHMHAKDAAKLLQSLLETPDSPVGIGSKFDS